MAAVSWQVADVSDRVVPGFEAGVVWDRGPSASLPMRSWDPGGLLRCLPCPGSSPGGEKQAGPRCLHPACAEQCRGAGLTFLALLEAESPWRGFLSSAFALSSVVCEPAAAPALPPTP